MIICDWYNISINSKFAQFYILVFVRIYNLVMNATLLTGNTCSLRKLLQKRHKCQMMESSVIHFAIGWIQKLWDNLRPRSTASDNATPHHNHERRGERHQPFTLLICNNVHLKSRKMWIDSHFMQIITLEINNVSYYWMLPKYFTLWCYSLV